MNRLRNLRDLLSLFARSERVRFALLVVSILLMGVMEIIGIVSVVPFLAFLANENILDQSEALRKVYDFLGFQSHNAFLAFLGVAVIVVMFVANSFITGMNLYLQYYGNRQIHKLGVRLLRHYLRKDYAFFLSRNASEFIADILGEVAAIVNGLLVPMLGLLSGLITVGSILAVLFATSPGLSLVAIAILAFSFGIAYAASRKTLGRLGVQRRKLVRVKQKSLLEIFGGIKDIKVSARENLFLERFARPSLKMVRIRTIRQVLGLLPSYVIQTVANTGLIAAGLYMVTTYERDMGRIIPVLGIFALAIMRILPALQNIYKHVVNLKYSGHSFAMLKHELLAATEADEKPDEAPGREPAECLPLREAIEFDNVSFRYEGAKHRLFGNLTLTIPAYSTLGIVGSTGAGKSTLIDLVCGLLYPEGGEILIDGAPLTRDNVRRWQQSLGYVPQQIYLSDDTIARNIAFGVPKEELDQQQVENAARMANIHNFIVSEMPDGYGTFVGDRGIRLSGGQRQRIGIARALYRNPQLLILDEATSAVDNITERLVMEAIEKAASTRTVIIIAHRLTTVKNCDRILYLEDGQLKNSGTYEDLLEKSPGFRSLVDAVDTPGALAT